jgi:hypothetical protein
MPKATVTLSLLVTLDVPDEYVAKVTREDLIEMARSAVPDSMALPDPASGHGGAADGTQTIVEGVAQEDAQRQPIFAEVFIEHDICADVEIDFDEDGFEKAELETDAE